MHESRKRVISDAIFSRLLTIMSDEKYALMASVHSSSLLGSILNTTLALLSKTFSYNSTLSVSLNIKASSRSCHSMRSMKEQD